MGRKFDYKTILLVGVLLVLLSACKPEQVQTPTPTAIVVPTATATITPTITNTPTLTWIPLPTRTNTSTPKPVSLSEHGPWFILRNENGFYISDIDGAHIQPLPIPQDTPYILSRDISPNGKLISIYVEYKSTLSDAKNENLYDKQIWIMDIPSLQIVKKINLSTPEYKYLIRDDDFLIQVLDFDESSSWSPDGRYFAFTAVLKNNTSNIYLYDSFNNQISPLVTDMEKVVFMGWTPDSQKILFQQSLISQVYLSGILMDDVWSVTIDGSKEFVYNAGWGDYIDSWINEDTILVVEFDIDPPSYGFRKINIKNKKTNLLYPGPFCGVKYAPTSDVVLVDMCHLEYFNIRDGLYVFSKGNNKAQIIKPGDFYNLKWNNITENFFVFYRRSEFVSNLLILNSYGYQIKEIEGVNEINISPNQEYFLAYNYSDPTLRLYSNEGELIITTKSKGGVFWTSDSNAFYLTIFKNDDNQCLFYQYTEENDWAETSFTLPFVDCIYSEIIQPK